jgi:L,D-transpeptidase catalytic domain
MRSRVSVGVAFMLCAVFALGSWLRDDELPVAPVAATAPDYEGHMLAAGTNVRETPRCVAGSIQPVSEPGGAVAARLIRPTTARRTPGGTPISGFGLVNINGVRTVFGVLHERLGADCRATWLRVQLPIRPNGSVGWVRVRDVRRFKVAARVTVDLSERNVTVVQGGRKVLSVDAAIGKPETPTPTGRFYVNQRLLASDPTGPWGPGGVGVSAFSPVLQDWAQGGPIAIHGTNTPQLIGSAVSNGCVRISNFNLRQLMRLAPEGTPVVIRA